MGHHPPGIADAFLSATEPLSDRLVDVSVGPTGALRVVTPIHTAQPGWAVALVADLTGVDHDVPAGRYPLPAVRDAVLHASFAGLSLFRGPTPPGLKPWPGLGDPWGGYTGLPYATLLDLWPEVYRAELLCPGCAL